MLPMNWNVSVSVFDKYGKKLKNTQKNLHIFQKDSTFALDFGGEAIFGDSMSAKNTSKFLLIGFANQNQVR